MGISREETSGSNQFMRDRFCRERDRDGVRGKRGDRAKERGTRRQKKDAQGEREEKEESEMARGQPDRTLCQLSDLLVRRHGEALFTTKSLVDNAG